MNSFYLLFGIIALAAAVLGYVIGGIRMITTLSKLVASAAITFLFFDELTRLLVDRLVIMPWAAQLVAISIIFFVSCITIHFILQPVARKVSACNSTLLNRIAGSVTGLLMAITGFSYFAVTTSIMDMPPVVKQELEQRGIAAIINSTNNCIAEKLFVITNEEPVKVMASKAIGISHEEYINLSFSTTDYTARPDLEYDMLQLINKERREQGLSSLLPDTLLLKAARSHSIDMITRAYFSHHTPEGKDPFYRLHAYGVQYRYAGENLALAPTLIKAHEGLMQSPGHRANILNRSYGRAGIAVIDAGKYGLMITQEFRD